MKKTFELIMLLLSMLSTQVMAQEKMVRTVRYSLNNADASFANVLRRALGSELYKVDSLVLYQDIRFPEDWCAALADCCENGRLTGIDMSHCYVREIPAGAFLPGTVNAAPGMNAAEGDVNIYRTNLRYITLPPCLRKIGDYAFGCTNLERIEIPLWVEETGNGAFSGCEHLKNVVLRGNSIHDSAMGYAFDGLPDDAVLHVAPGLGGYYSGNEAWSDFGEVREDDTAFKVLTLTLDGSMPLKDVLGSDNMRVDSMKISGVLSSDDFDVLCENSYYGCLFGLDLTDVDLDNSYGITLWDCDFNTLVLPRRMPEIPSAMLAGTYVRHLTLPESYDKICWDAFRSYRGEFKDSVFVVAEGCRRINHYAFGDFHTIKAMILPSTLDEVEPLSLSFYIYGEPGWYQSPPIDVYVNRMYPPQTIHEYNGVPISELREHSPFGCDYGMHSSDNCLLTRFTLYVPMGAKKNYENAKYWKDFGTIIETPLLTGTSTGISDVHAASGTPTADGIYTVDGRFVGKGTKTDTLPRGLYIVRANGQTRKVLTGR